MAPELPAVLAVDGGNSKTDVALVASDGTLLASARGPGINAHDVGVDQTVLILDAVVKQAADRLDRRYRMTGIPVSRSSGNAGRAALGGRRRLRRGYQLRRRGARRPGHQVPGPGHDLR